MFFDRNIKYRDILIFALIGIVGFKLIDNYSVFFDAIGKFMSIISPFIYALVFAYVLNPVMKLFEKKLKLKRSLAILATYLLIVGLIVIGMIFIVPNIVESIISITSEVPKYMEIVQGWINKLLENENIYSMVQDSGLTQNLTSISSKLGQILINLLEGSVSSIASTTMNIVKIAFGFLISIYVLADKEKFKNGIKTVMYMVLKKERTETCLQWIRTYNRMIGIYIGTKAIDSAIIGTLALIGLLIMRAPYAILIALVVGITNMIPYFGPFVGEIVGAFIGVFVSPTMAIMIFLYLLALQQFDAWYLDPKLIGNKVGLGPFYIILAVTIGGGFFGAIGMLLASPTMATINILYEKKVAKFKEKNKGLLSELDEEGDESK